MFNEIKKTIQLDLLYYNNSNIIILLILCCLTKNILFTFIILIFYNIINKFNKINIEHNNYNNYNIIKISNKYKNISYQLFNNKYQVLKYIWMCFCNLNIKPEYITKIFMRTLIYNKTNIVIKYQKNINIPNKFILLLNHTHINYDDYTHIFITLLLFPEHKYVIITNNSCNKLLQKFGYLFGQYIIKDNKTILYEDMSNLIKNNEKIVIIIFPEGNIKRTCSLKNYNINQKNIHNFSIIEDRCFNYKKGAFIISLTNKIPILPAILYSPMPNNNYIYFNKIYKIKHINHIGINIFNNIVATQQFDDVEEYRLKMESIFKKRYINVLLNANKYNI